MRSPLIAAALLAACASPAPVARIVPAAPAAPAATWLALDGAQLLVTTTRGARGHRDADLPLLIVLPWSHSRPQELLGEVGYADLDVPARIVAVQGFVADRGGYSFWVRARGPAPAQPDDDAELVELLAARAARLARLVDRIRQHFAAPAAPVISGLSQGGDLSLALALHHPASISAALPIGARAPAASWRDARPHPAPPPIDAYQGTADEPAPYAPFARASEALRQRGFPLALHRYPGLGHGMFPPMRADLHACLALRLRGSRAACPTTAPPAATAPGTPAPR